VENLIFIPLTLAEKNYTKFP